MEFASCFAQPARAGKQNNLTNHVLKRLNRWEQGLAGGVPADVRPIFFGASLHALKKKEGGIRPISIGLTLRRLISNVANTWATSVCSSTFLPHQMGVGAKGWSYCSRSSANVSIDEIKHGLRETRLRECFQHSETRFDDGGRNREHPSTSPLHQLELRFVFYPQVRNDDS